MLCGLTKMNHLHNLIVTTCLTIYLWNDFLLLCLCLYYFLQEFCAFSFTACLCNHLFFKAPFSKNAPTFSPTIHPCHKYLLFSIPTRLCNSLDVCSIIYYNEVIEIFYHILRGSLMQQTWYIHVQYTP